MRRDRIIRLQRARRGKAYALVIRCHLFAATCVATAAGRCNFIVEHCCDKRSVSSVWCAPRIFLALLPCVVGFSGFRSFFSESRWIATCNKSEPPSLLTSRSSLARLVAWCFWEPERVNQCRKGRKVSVRAAFCVSLRAMSTLVRRGTRSFKRARWQGNETRCV